MRLAILAFVAGAALLQQQAQLVASAPPWVLVAALVLGAALFPPYRTFVAKALFICAAAVAGFTWANALAEVRLAQRLDLAWEGRDVVVIGIVADLPRAAERGTRFLLDIEQATAVEPSAVVSAMSVRRVALTWYKPRQSVGGDDGAAPKRLLQPGERWRFEVPLQRPHGTANPFTFDFERWALERNIGATGYVREKSIPQRLGAVAWRPGYIVDRWRADIRARLAQALRDRPYADVITALAVGDQSGIDAEQWRLFWRSGIGHLISISGLHVTMVAGLFGGLGGWAWRRSSRLMLAVPAQRIAVLAQLPQLSR
jgi:competence protein ComEC